MPCSYLACILIAALCVCAAAGAHKALELAIVGTARGCWRREAWRFGLGSGPPFGFGLCKLESVCWARRHGAYSRLGLHSCCSDSAGRGACAHGTLCRGFGLSGSIMKCSALPGWVCAEVSVLRIWADEPPCSMSLGGGSMLTGLARVWMHVGAPQGASGLL